MSNINIHKQGEQQEINVQVQQQEPVFAPMQNVQHQQQVPANLNRSAEAAGQTRQRMKALKNMVTYNKAIHCPSKTALKGEFGRAFKSNVSVKKRSAAMENHRSRLYKKKANAQTLKNVESAIADESIKIISGIIDNSGMVLGKNQMMDVAAFFTEKDGYHSKEIARLAFGEGKAQEGRDMTKAMDHMLAMISDTELKNVRLDNDIELVAHAGELERLSWQISAFDRLNKEYDYLGKLDEETKEAVEQKLDAVRSIANYYRLRKDIINDPEYQSRYNDELSMDFTTARNEEEKAIGKKLYAAFLAGKEMLRLNGANESLVRKQGDPVFGNKREQEDFNNRYSIGQKYIKQDMVKGYAGSDLLRKAEEKLRKNKIVKEHLTENAVQQLEDYKGDLEKQADFKEEPYDQSKLDGYCAELRNMDFADFKIGSYWDMTEFFSENYALCEKAARLDHEIVRGLVRGWKGPGENMLITLRAKAKAIDSIKKTICVVNGALATVKESADYTDEQWESYIKDYLDYDKGKGYHFLVYEPGKAQDLFNKYRAIFDEEDDTKEQTIKDTYAALISVKEKEEIPPEELEERKRNYNKNAFIQDWLSRDTVKPGLATVTGAITNLMKSRKGLKDIPSPRTFEAISAGKSAEEVMHLFNLATGDAEQQLQYYTTILDTVFNVPLKEYNTDDLGSFFDNWAKKEEAGRLATDNIMKVGLEIKELLEKNPDLKLPEKYGDIDELVIKTEAMHHHGCALTGGRIDALQQIRSAKYTHVFSVQEMGSFDQETLKATGDRLLDFEAEKRPFLRNDDPAGPIHDNLYGLYKRISFLNMDDDTQELSNEEIKAGKQRDRLNFGVDVEAYYQKYLDKEYKKRGLVNPSK